MTLLIAVTIISILALIIFLYRLSTGKLCNSNVCLLGKVALVTGGNSGIGYQVVLSLASRGCRVIIADKVHDTDLKEKIFRETNSENIVLKYVDLASFKSVREFANDIIKSEEKLDILVNNAGIGRTDVIITEDGLDMTMQVNYFSAFLLTHLLLDLLKKASGRVIFTSSYTALSSTLTLNKLTPSSVGTIDYVDTYPNSKLGAIIIADIFAKKLKKHNVKSNSYHPGIVYTSIFSKERHLSKKLNFTYVWILLLEFLALIAGKTPQEGAQTAIFLSCAKEVENVTGKFFGEMKSTFKPNRKAYDKKFCQEIWNATEKLVKLEPNERIVDS